LAPELSLNKHTGAAFLGQTLCHPRNCRGPIRATSWHTQQDFAGWLRMQKSNHLARNGLAFVCKLSIAMGDWKMLMGAFGSNPAGPFAWVGLRWCGGWRRAHL
jgi:hypothetical protein